MIKIEKIEDLLQFFKDELGKPIVLTKHQQEIFNIIVKQKFPRNIVITPTRFGKSFTISLAVIVRAVVFPEKWAIVAPSEKKAKIIMNYIIQHLFDHEIFSSQLEVERGSLERLKRERSKERLTFRRGGETYVLSADARNKQAAGEALMGFGSKKLIIDESCSLDDDIYSKAKRMLGDDPANSFLFEIGNPFRRNHFLRSWRSQRYNKIFVDYKIAYKDWLSVNKEKAEAYLDFVNEMKEERDFSVLFECKFPDEEEADSDGWFPLLFDNEIEASMGVNIPMWGEKFLGIDVASGGRNKSVWVIRSNNVAKVVKKSNTSNLMEIVGSTLEIIKEFSIDRSNIFVDIVGVGRGVYDRLLEKGIPVNPISGGTKVKGEFANLRALLYNRASKWIKAGGRLEKQDCWYQLNDIKYKYDSADKLKIISKVDLKKRGVESPDEADAFSFTFFNKWYSENIDNFDYNQQEDIISNRQDYESQSGGEFYK